MESSRSNSGMTLEVLPIRPEGVAARLHCRPQDIVEISRDQLSTHDAQPAHSLDDGIGSRPVGVHPLQAVGQVFADLVEQCDVVFLHLASVVVQDFGKLLVRFQRAFGKVLDEVSRGC